LGHCDLVEDMVRAEAMATVLVAGSSGVAVPVVTFGAGMAITGYTAVAND